MKDLRDLLDLTRKKPVRVVLLFLSSVVILSASGLVYGGMVNETPLNVGGSSGVFIGSPSSGLSLTAATMAILAVAAFAISFSVFGILYLASKRAGGRKDERGSLSTGPVLKESEWEEAPRKEEDEE